MKIIAALDRTEHSWKVLEKALELVTLHKAELTVVTVAEEIADFGDSGVSMTLIDAIRRQSEKFLGEVRKRLGSLGVSAAIRLEGDHSPAEAILRVAETEKADLIVMGHQSRSTIDRFFIGSVASKVVSNAPCSVYVVR